MKNLTNEELKTLIELASKARKDCFEKKDPDSIRLPEVKEGCDKLQEALFIIGLEADKVHSDRIARAFVAAMES